MDTSIKVKDPSLTLRVAQLGADFYYMVWLKIGHYIAWHMHLSRYSYQYGSWHCYWCDRSYPRAGWECSDCCIPDKFRSISKKA